MRRFLILIIVGIIWFGYWVNRWGIERARNKSSFEQTHLIFSGVITKIIEIPSNHNYGILRLEILNSNVQNYDPRDSVEFYFCIIKGKSAEVYDYASPRKLGDTLNINASQSIEWVGSKGHARDSGSAGINPDRGYYDYIKEHTIFKR